MKRIPFFILFLACFKLMGDEPKVDGARKQLDGKNALWEKIGPHAPKGSQLAKDNRTMFAVYYDNIDKSLSGVVKESSNQEIYSLMCLPTSYGWPMYRTFNKDIQYTGLVGIRIDGEYEVMIEVVPKKSKAQIILAVDGKAKKQFLQPNKPSKLLLKAGVRALSIRTKGDVQLQFAKIHIMPVLDE